MFCYFMTQVQFKSRNKKKNLKKKNCSSAIKNFISNLIVAFCLKKHRIWSTLQKKGRKLSRSLPGLANKTSIPDVWTFCTNRNCCLHYLFFCLSQVSETFLVDVLRQTLPWIIFFIIFEECFMLMYIHILTIFHGIFFQYYYLQIDLLITGWCQICDFMFITLHCINIKIKLSSH